MARKSTSTAVQEELYPRAHGEEYGSREYDSRSQASGHDAGPHEPFDDARLIDLEADQESPFLRGQKRVTVRRGSLPRKTANSLKWIGLALLIVAFLSVAAAVLYRYGKHSWRFRIDSSDQIEVAGAQHVSHAQIMEVMGGDIGRNIFFVPLSQRKQQLQQIPWVESASVMRFVPNRLRIEIHERTPVAFARVGTHISLIDAGGNLMELTPGPKQKYSFPVITGMNASEPLSTRAARMKNYNELMRQLDSGGSRYSQDVSEVDLTDAEDVKVIVADSNGEVLVHLGSGNYLQRYRVYMTHVQAWRQQFDKLDSVDLRYDGQIIVNPDLQGIARQPALTPAAAKAALAAGVKNAALLNYEKYVTHPAPPASAVKPAHVQSKELNPNAKDGVRVTHTAAHSASPKSRTKSKARITRNHAAAVPSAEVKPAVKPAAPTAIAGSGSVKPNSTNSPSARSVAGPTPAAPLADAGNKPAHNAPAPATKTKKPTKSASAAATPSAALVGAQKKPSPIIRKENSQN